MKSMNHLDELTVEKIEELLGQAEERLWLPTCFVNLEKLAEAGGYLMEHSLIVASLLNYTLSNWGLPQRIIDGAFLGGFLHDNGKLMIPGMPPYLEKPFDSPSQKKAMKKHPVYGAYAVLRELENQGFIEKGYFSLTFAGILRQMENLEKQLGPRLALIYLPLVHHEPLFPIKGCSIQSTAGPWQGIINTCQLCDIVAEGIDGRAWKPEIPVDNLIHKAETVTRTYGLTPAALHWFKKTMESLY
ncbi:hypothetical protein JXB41_02240 [Candidatus Woesearchaeota archaeon]|nr:hypothetical protein [Candidatus Woesearchaeota archaeon]